MSLSRHLVAVWLPADQLYSGHSVEVEVARGKYELMLTREGRDPQVILGNRTPAKAQLRLGQKRRRALEVGAEADELSFRFLARAGTEVSALVLCGGSAQIPCASAAVALSDATAPR